MHLTELETEVGVTIHSGSIVACKVVRFCQYANGSATVIA